MVDTERRRRGWLGVAAVAVAVGACGGADESDPEAWSYRGDRGPEHWGELAGEYAMCAAGRAQSPIDLAEATEVDLVDIAVGYEETPLRALNNGHTVEVEVEPGAGHVTYNARRYELQQFHFHRPSEHTINGAAAPMELHLVHRSSDGEILVLGVLLVAGAAETPAIATVFENLPAAEGDLVETDARVDLAGLLPASLAYTTYAGSLTTPPCSEGVRWVVLAEPVTLSTNQIDAFGAALEHEDNARPVQPRHDRDVLADT